MPDKTSPKTSADNGWFAELCVWADGFAIPEEELPRDIAALRDLRELTIHLGHRHQEDHLFRRPPRLTYLPAAIAHLLSLRHLIVRKNRLHELPPGIGGLRHLQWLDLYNNQLVTLPPETSQLRQLTWLDLRGKIPCKLYHRPYNVSITSVAASWPSIWMMHPC